jgi:integrative and conjugative element protein (TIGR02256 family)
MAEVRGLRRMSISGVNLYASDGTHIAVITEDVIAYLSGQRQRTWSVPERGGQLFAQFDGLAILVEASGPCQGDRSGPMWFEIDASDAQNDIRTRFASGRHFIGDWHTHAQKRPTPSPRDVVSMQALFATSVHELTLMFMIIVGSGSLPDQWWYSIHNNDTMERLHAVSF